MLGPARGIVLPTLASMIRQVCPSYPVPVKLGDCVMCTGTRSSSWPVGSVMVEELRCAWSIRTWHWKTMARIKHPSH